MYGIGEIMEYCERKQVLLRDTDCTGIINFSTLQQWCAELFEQICIKKSIAFHQNEHFPIVDVHAVYRKPLKWRDICNVSLKAIVWKKHSFEAHYEVNLLSTTAFTAQFTHVFLVNGKPHSVVEFKRKICYFRRCFGKRVIVSGHFCLARRLRRNFSTLFSDMFVFVAMVRVRESFFEGSLFSLL